MRERPILFNGEMVRAILDGRKTQTRRIVKGAEAFRLHRQKEGRHFFHDGSGSGVHYNQCPYSKGQRLWVRETFWEGLYFRDTDQSGERCSSWNGHILGYSADGFKPGKKYCGKRPSIHMPRRASRITLEITDIRVERLQDISEEDAIAEGLMPVVGPGKTKMWEYSNTKGGQFSNPVVAFQMLWMGIHGKESWYENPWVWVIEYAKKIK